MSNYLTYLIESNVCLVVFVGIYQLLLRHDTNFNLKRFTMLGGIFASLLFPLVSFSVGEVQLLPSMKEAIATIWLPEMTVVGAPHAPFGEDASLNLIQYLSFGYAVGAIFFLVLFMKELVTLSVQIYKSKKKVFNDVVIAECESTSGSFSFFHYISIGNARELTDEEKSQIIAHESVHATRLHSLDILSVNILKIFFWFNPLVTTCKNILIELHEFEADARSVKNSAVNDYCNLLAKVALMSADLRLANYFTNSLTLKRIEMIRKIKMKTKRWKLYAIAASFPAMLLVVACQEQVISEVSEVAKSSTMAIDLPQEVQTQYDAMKSAKPESNLLVLEVDEAGKAKLEEMEKKMKAIDQSSITAVNVIKTKGTSGEQGRNFIIVEYNENVAKVSQLSQTDDVFAVVEESATPVGGIEELYKFIGEHLQYPEEARSQKIEGQVFVEFIVEKDGSISNPVIMKGLDPTTNKAALDVVSAFPKWQPGKQKGETVRQKMVLPINFKLG